MGKTRLRVYVGMKEKACDRLGIQSQTRILPEDTTEKDLLKLIGELNADSTLHGILVQAPLPSQINEANIFAAVSANKDVDGFHPLNVGKLLLGDTDGFVPCTPPASMSCSSAAASHQRRRSRDPRPRQHRRQTHGRNPLPEIRTR